MQPAKINYKIFQGGTFQETFRWESETKVYVPIQAISKAAPCVITTTTPHNLPVGWRFRVVGAGGMKEINSVGESTYYLSTAYNVVPPTLIDTDALEDDYLIRLEIWENVRDQDAVLVAPVLRPWRLMTTQDAYNFIMQQNQQYLPAIPSSFPPILSAANNAYTAWQQAIASNQAAIAAAQASVANKIEINQTNSLNYTTYTSGGVVEFNKPVPLTGLAARMQIRETVDSTTVIHEATTQNNQIVLDNTNKTIQVTLLANVTQNFNFATAVYSLELYNGNNVIPFINGNLTLVQEVTR
jgi:hypothetical protein